MNDNEIKVSQLAEAEELNENDIFMIVQAGVNKKLQGRKIGGNEIVISTTEEDITSKTKLFINSLTSEAKYKDGSDWISLAGDEVIIGTESDITDNTKILIEEVPEGSNIPYINSEIAIGSSNDSNIPVWFKQGKNLCNNETLNLALNYQNNTIISDANSKTVYAVVPKNTDITISKTSVTNRFRVGLLNAIPQNNDSVNIVFRDDDSSTLSTTINTSTYTIVAIQYTNSNQTTNIQVEIGETATAYEPYVRKAININGEDEYYTNDYSTAEQVIGTWLGKPLYRKTINFGALPNNSSKQVAIDVTNFDKLVNLYGVAYSTGYTMLIPFIHNDLSNIVNVYFNNGTKEIGVATHSDRSGYTESYITIEYTKTTD